MAIRGNLSRAIAGLATAIVLGTFSTPPARAASALTLAPELSFVDDSSNNFPIVANGADDGSSALDRPTVIFFGTSHCWNTNREAERLVALYPQYRDRVHFVVVDLNHVAPDQRGLVKKYYGGYIPTVVIFDRNGKVVYDRAGETAARRSETGGLAALIDSSLK
jgi:thiol-disulfide isomerase/thioredoxin